MDDRPAGVRIRPYRASDREHLKEITIVCFEPVSIDRAIEDNGTAHLGNGPAAPPRALLRGRQDASGRAAAKEGETTLEAEEHRIAATQSDAPACHTCGSIMLRTGSCYVCTNCGSNSGCS
jgi:hypothetical protein